MVVLGGGVIPCERGASVLTFGAMAGARRVAPEPPQGVLVCGHAGFVTSKLSQVHLRSADIEHLVHTFTHSHTHTRTPPHTLTLTHIHSHSHSNTHFHTLTHTHTLTLTYSHGRCIFARRVSSTWCARRSSPPPPRASRCTIKPDIIHTLILRPL